MVTRRISKLSRKAAEQIGSMLTTWAVEAWNETGRTRPKKLLRVYSVWSSYTALGLMLMNNLGEENADFYFALESETDLLASTLLVMSGYARHANALLRGWLEDVFLGLWFGFDDGGYRKWTSGDPDAPFKDRSFFNKPWLKELLNKTPFRDYSGQHRLVSRVLRLYQQLSREVHAQDIKTHETKTWGDSVARFQPDLFDKWYANVILIFRIMTIVIVLRYPTLPWNDSELTGETIQLIAPLEIDEILRSTRR